MDRHSTHSINDRMTRHGTLLVADPAEGGENGAPVSTRYCPHNRDEQRVLDALATVVDPCSIGAGVPIGIADMGLVREIVVASGTVTVKLRLTNPFCFQIGIICEAIEKKVQALDLACVIEVNPVDPWSTDLMTEEARDRLRRKREA